MLLRQKNVHPRALSAAGLFLLSLASGWRLFVHPGPWLSGRAVDAVSGFLYGVTIGILVVALLRSRGATGKFGRPGLPRPGGEE